MMIIESMLTNGDQITFSILFIALLLWVINTNEKRETKYQETITALTNAINNFDDLKQSMKEIKEKMNNWSERS